ncbi:hypothetical protein FNV43_RR20240 [Rhamnella rubrinervis]|uniref:DUF1421 domain-containing protein n=1 Tax=Rhamnella rubrinervis TaxID=2594499 RepID=A0A8K0GQA0_9ROSA|nr:hypothetical protein FNV43_RR20240 [Rhamnella rubrinervis]
MSDFMDKRIMELSRSYSDDFSELSYPQGREGGGGDDLHSYELSNDDFDSGFHFHPINPVKSGSKSVGTFGDVALISLIECKMKEQSETLLHAVEGLSLRLCQVESRTRQIEHSIEDMKDSTKYHYGRTEGKLRELENILREVQNGIQDLRDKQEISEVKSQIEKLKMAKGHEQSENQKHNVKTSLSQGMSSYTQQQRHQPNPSHVASVQQLPSPQPNVPPVQYHQNLPPTPTAAQLPTQLPHNYSQVQSSYSQPVLNPESTHHQQYSIPPPQQSQPPPSGPYQAYRPVQQIPPQSQVQQMPQLRPPLNAVDPQVHHSMVQRAEMPYVPSQSYSPSTQMTFNNAPGFAPPSQQINSGSIQRIYDQPSRGPSADYLPKQPSRYSNLHDAYSSKTEFPSQSHYSSSRMRPSQIPPSSSVPASGSSFSRLPTARLLPHAMASNVDSGSSSSGTGNSLRVEDVIDNVVAMGFRRDTVRATVRKMTENGQSVDLNMVLDKLMNNGEVQS